MSASTFKTDDTIAARLNSKGEIRWTLETTVEKDYARVKGFVAGTSGKLKTIVVDRRGVESFVSLAVEGSLTVNSVGGSVYVVGGKVYGNDAGSGNPLIEVGYFVDLSGYDAAGKLTAVNTAGVGQDGKIVSVYAADKMVIVEVGSTRYAADDPAVYDKDNNFVGLTALKKDDAVKVYSAGGKVIAIKKT